MVLMFSSWIGANPGQHRLSAKPINKISDNRLILQHYCSNIKWNRPDTGICLQRINKKIVAHTVICYEFRHNGDAQL